MPQVEERDDDEVGTGSSVPSDPPAVDGEPPKVTINLADADDEPEAPLAPRQGEREPRHKSQWRQMKESHEQALSELREKIARLEGRASQPPIQINPPGDRQATADPREAEIKTVWRQQQRLLASVRGGQHTEAEVRELENEWQTLDRKRRAIENAVDNGTPQERESPEDRRNRQGYEMLQLEYPEVFQKKHLTKAAEAEFEYLKEERGKPDTVATAREAIQRVMARKGLGRKVPAPSPAEKVRHSGTSGRAGASGGGGEGDYTPNKMLMGLARSYTAHLPDMTDEERYKHWRKYVGKKHGLVP